MAYTQEQIQSVCDKGYEVMGHFTDVQNCLFPSTVIIEGMNAGLDAATIGQNAYDAIAKLPLRQTGFGLVGMGDSMHNIALYLQNAVEKAILEIDAANSAP